MKTRTTGEAMGVLEGKYSHLIDIGRRIARRIAEQRGTVTSRDVRAELAEQGLLDESQQEFWLGAIFRRSEFEQTGEWLSYTDENRNVHERQIRVWRLRHRPSATSTPLLAEPQSPLRRHFHEFIALLERTR